MQSIDNGKIAAAVLAFVMAGMLMYAGMTSLRAMQKSSVTSSDEYSQTLVVDNTTVQELDWEPIISVASVQNASIVFTSGNYTINNELGTIDFAGSEPSLHGWTIRVNYTYAARTTMFTTLQNSNLALENISSQFPTIAMIFAIGIIISIVVFAFGQFGGNKGS